MFRHGDIGLVPITGVPDGATDITLECTVDGRIILAEGEATGHAHAVVDAPRARPMALSIDGMSAAEAVRRAQLVEIVPTLPPSEGPVHVWQLGATTYMTVPSPRILEHEEHGQQIIPAGTYRVLRQREYEYGGERRVVD